MVAEGELQEYLKEHRVESFLKDLVLQICLTRPPDVPEFVRAYAAAQLIQKEADDSAEQLVA